MNLFRRKEKLPALVDERANTILPADTTDSQILDLWLKQHAPQSQEGYARDIARFSRMMGHPALRTITLSDLQRFKDELAASGLARATIARRISAVKSLLSFCATTGYLALNVGSAIKPPKAEEKLAERIMSESQMQRILALETNPRNHAILRLLYNAGLRVSELCALTWSDVQIREQGGQIRAYGKGEEERYILISAETYQDLLRLRSHDVGSDTPVFRSRKSSDGGRLTRGQVARIIEEAGIRAGVATYQEINKESEAITRSRVSPHWIRHAHASHAIDRGAPVTLVRDTLGHKSLTTTNKYSHARPNSSSGTFLAI